MNSLTALRSLRSSAPAFAGQSRGFAKATMLGGLIAEPEERQTASGKSYFMYRIAVERAPKKDEAGNVQRDENGYAIRDSDFHTIFNFKENASQTLTGIPVGSKLLIEAAIGTRQSEVGGTNITQTTLSELSHKIVSRPKKTE